MKQNDKIDVILIKNPNEPEKMTVSYLDEMDNGYHSISFPLISSGIFGGSLANPVAESTKQCLRAYKVFTSDYPDYDIDVKLCAFGNNEMIKAQNEWNNQ